ncbi:MAG: shikimate dehydrogenase [Campylobacterales bacterium]|nr:shikimate dehydrogenase [Campylobacterales bacterium]
MKKFTIFGNPVEHSKSPQMHNAGFRHINFDGDYDKTFLKDGSTIKEVFLQQNLSGANITVPHKENAYAKADVVEGIASIIGAVNTYILKGNKIYGYNTDAPGFLKAIEEYGNIKNVLILGAGGTARALAVAFKDKNIPVSVINRSENRLEFFDTLGLTTYTWESFSLAANKFDLIVNTTSAGLKDDKLPCPEILLNAILKNSKYAVDCIYGKQTPFLQKAQKYNLKFKDGEDMLLYQGVLAFELFTGVKADKQLIEAMRYGLKNNS